MSDRTAMFIDIEGFGALYEANTPSDSMWGLSKLMEGIFDLGQDSPRLGIPRLFAHHVGDGFVVVDDSGQTNLNRMVGVAVALQQHTLLASGHFCAAAIACGEMADVVGCYPERVLDARVKEGIVRMGDGLMTVFPVMRTAIINTYRILKKVKGAVIVVPDSQGELEPGIRVSRANGLLYVDWVASESPSIAAAREILRLQRVDHAELKRAFREAVARNKCSEEWIALTKQFSSLD